MAVDNSFLVEIASASEMTMSYFSSGIIMMLKFMEIGWDSLKANAYAASDSNSAPNSKTSYTYLYCIKM